MLTDFHLHTLVSDGELDPAGVVAAAAAHGVGHLAITDHDALGAYAWQAGRVFREAERLGVALTVGIEMDADLDGVEVHVLGFDLARDETALLRHLELVRTARAERARREIGIVNALLGAGTIDEAEVFCAGRETLMKPHFIHPLLRRGLFPSYGAANTWYRKNVDAGVAVPKPALAAVVGLIQGAGGWAVLAHPGYYEGDGRPGIAERLPALQAMGLDGIELDYPYHACSPDRFSTEAERAYVGQLRAAAEPLGLRLTRGSDSHTAADFDRTYGPAA